MLIWSHILDEKIDSTTYTSWFTDAAYKLHMDAIAQRLALLLHHDEIWATCSYLPEEQSDVF